MEAFQSLSACEGSWRGTNRLQDPHSGASEDTPSRLTLTPLLDGRFVRIDHDWGYRGTPQTGSVRVVMFNIAPEGREDLAVETEYGRSG